MHLYNYENLSGLQGQNLILVDSQGQKVSLEIVKVEKSKLHTTRWESFSLVLLGNTRVRIPQGTYQLHHPDLGSDIFFLSPKSALEYELIINREIMAETT